MATEIECLEQMSNLKQTLCNMVYEYVQGVDAACIDTVELGQFIDMIKDLAAAERYYAQSKYYNSVIESMNNNRMGYIRGLNPNDETYYGEDDYSDVSRLNRMMNRGIQAEEELIPYYGKSYSEYEKARRHYTETHSMTDKKSMNDRAGDYILESIETIKEMWSSLDPDIRRKMKEDMTKLVSEMS